MKQEHNQLINLQNIHAVNRTLYELLCLRRWSELIVTPGQFTELGKQAFNCMVTYFWATEIAHTGVQVDFTKFPKIALSRSFTKTIQCDIPEGNLATILKLAGISQEDFRKTILGKIENSITPEFSKHTQVDPDCLEARIYRGATKVATLIELRGIRKFIDEQDYRQKETQLIANLSSYSNLPCYEQIMSATYQEIFRNFSKLKN